MKDWETETAMGRVGVLLLNLGGPDELDDVGPFLTQKLFAYPFAVYKNPWRG
jgi:ferrochelatase